MGEENVIKFMSDGITFNKLKIDGTLPLVINIGEYQAHNVAPAFMWQFEENVLYEIIITKKKQNDA